MKKAVVLVQPKLGTTYSVYRVMYDGEQIHASISALDQQDVDDVVKKYLAGPDQERPLLKLRQIAAPKSLRLAGSKAAASTAFRKTVAVKDSSFYIEDEEV